MFRLFGQSNLNSKESVLDISVGLVSLQVLKNRSRGKKILSEPKPELPETLSHFKTQNSLMIWVSSRTRDWIRQLFKLCKFSSNVVQTLSDYWIKLKQKVVFSSPFIFIYFFLFLFCFFSTVKDLGYYLKRH